MCLYLMKIKIFISHLKKIFILGLNLDPDPDPYPEFDLDLHLHSSKRLDPDPHIMYADTKHCLGQ
jgi:hypothetical protein